MFKDHEYKEATSADKPDGQPQSHQGHGHGQGGQKNDHKHHDHHEHHHLTLEELKEDLGIVLLPHMIKDPILNDPHIPEVLKNLYFLKL